MYVCDIGEVMIYLGRIVDGCDAENPIGKAIVVTLEPYDIY